MVETKEHIAFTSAEKANWAMAYLKVEKLPKLEALIDNANSPEFRGTPHSNDIKYLIQELRVVETIAEEAYEMVTGKKYE